MHKTLKNIFITALAASMVLGQAFTALADGPGRGPGTSAAGPGTADSSQPVGPGASSGGPGTSTAGPGSSGPGAGPGAAGPGASDTASAETPAAQETETRVTAPEITAPDVQQIVDSEVITVQVLQPDYATWTDVIYAGPSGASLSAPQGFVSMCIYHTSLPGEVMYRTYSSARGWSGWVMDGTHTPWSAGAMVEAFQIRLKGILNDYYDISYSSTLNDGTVCGWSYNGATNGTMGAGKYITGIQVYLTHKGDYDTAGTAGQVVSPTSMDGIQFGDGLPTFVSGTGTAFTGWAWHGNDQYYFVDNTAVTGWQYIDGYKYYFDEGGKLVTDLEPIIGANGPYLIRVNKQMNCTTVYVADGANGYIIPLKSFLCSTGSDTPLGTFRTPEKIRWNLMIHGVYCQYLTRLGPGLHILLHSGVYDAPDPFTLHTDTYNYMGVARSAGCIRFVTSDCKWIYDHCPIGTTIEVYNSPIPGPYERPGIPVFISSTQTWDPTDVEAAAVIAAQQEAAQDGQ